MKPCGVQKPGHKAGGIDEIIYKVVDARTKKVWMKEIW